MYWWNWYQTGSMITKNSQQNRCESISILHLTTHRRLCQFQARILKWRTIKTTMHENWINPQWMKKRSYGNLIHTLPWIFTFSPIGNSYYSLFIDRIKLNCLGCTNKRSKHEFGAVRENLSFLLTEPSWEYDYNPSCPTGM